MKEFENVINRIKYDIEKGFEVEDTARRYLSAIDYVQTTLQENAKRAEGTMDSNMLNFKLHARANLFAECFEKWLVRGYRDALAMASEKLRKEF